MPLFNKLLVANRGEIACRIMRTAKRLGIKTVGIYSEPDARAPHVAMADEAVCVGGAASSDSYLRVDNIMAVLKATGAEAVHPGYGFLSENAAFSEAVTAAGAAFVGPSAFAINAMGDKIESKRLAGAAGVSIIPGVESVLKNADEAVAVAKQVGYPVMLKASAGGGGKGMRIAYNDEEAAAGFNLSAAEAISSFGDDRIFVERYVERPRHIEIQLIADSHGNTIYLPPRDCSIQRRNQKVLEEAPAMHLDEATYRAMGEEAVALAKAVGYQSAGTVEYLVDAQQRHYFLEMNTRLQVEHPVTEEITGYDLVELMLRVAAGEHLPMKQEDVEPKGWSLEARVYAEDPLRNFLPSVGTLATYQPPSQAACAAAAALRVGGEVAASGKVRVDAGVQEGGEISVHYDPMISKLITHAPTRDAARALMLEALDRYAIRGVGLRHNINFLRTLVAHPRYAAGDVTTAFIPEEFPDGYSGHLLPAHSSEHADLLACAAVLQFASDRRATSLAGAAAAPPPSAAMLNVRLEDDAQDVTVDVALDTAYAAAGPLLPPHALLHVSGGCEAAGADGGHVTWQRSLKLAQTGLGPDGLLEALFVEGDGASERPMAVQILDKAPLGWALSAFGTSYDVRVRPLRVAALEMHMKPPPRSALDDALLSPMPGTLLSVLVEPGDAVFVGKELCVVEAMKMQNVLTATRDGVVKELLATPGSTLSADQPIVLFEEVSPAAAEAA